MVETIFQGLVPGGRRGDQWVVKPRIDDLISQAEAKWSHMAAKEWFPR